MNNKKYDNVLFGDISATILFKRIPTLKKIMLATHLHKRWIFGTDYPLPGIKLLIPVKKLINFFPNTIETPIGQIPRKEIINVL